MAKYKIDTAKIENFEGMTAEEKVEALLGQEIEVEAPTETADVTKLKTSLSKANSEAAEYKRLLREKQTEAERAEADRAEREKQRDAEIAELRAYKREADNTKKLVEAGVDVTTATVMAKALPDGVDDSYFDVMKQYIAAQKQTILSDALNKQPSPSVGVPPTASDAEAAEQAKLRRYIGLN